MTWLVTVNIESYPDIDEFETKDEAIAHAQHLARNVCSPGDVIYVAEVILTLSPTVQSVGDRS